MKANINAESIEILLTTRVDVAQLSAELSKVEALLKKPMGLTVNNAQVLVALKQELEAYKAINAEQLKHVNTMNKANTTTVARGNPTADLAAIVKGYKAEEAALTAHLSNMAKMRAGASTQAGGIAASPIVTSGISAAPLKAVNDELEKTDKHSRSIQAGGFPHKLFTTAQYMTAGALLAGAVKGVMEFTNAIVEADKALNMFQGVLEMTPKQAQQLQQEVFKIGTSFGGTIKDLNASALSLGRAGLASGELAGALKVVSQAALISGDSLENVTELLVSWHTVFPIETVQRLGDMMTKVANDSLSSFDDFKTMTNYLLTSTATMGLTAKSVIALAGAWRNLGKGASTTGTEVRRFMDQISNGSDDVNKAYGAMGVNLDKVQKGLAEGGAVAEATMAEVYRKMGDTLRAHPKLAAEVSAKLQTLDKATFNSNLGLAKQVETTSGVWQTAYSKMVASAEDSTGALAKANALVVVSYAVMWERIKNAASQGSSSFATAFKDSFMGATTTAGEFSSKMDAFSADVNDAMTSAGKALGSVASTISDLMPWINTLLIGFVAYKAILIALIGWQKLSAFWLAASAASTATYSLATGLATTATARLTLGTLASTVAQKALNVAMLANPWTLTAGLIATAISALLSWNNEMDKALVKSNKMNAQAGMKTFKASITGMDRAQQIATIKADSAALRDEQVKLLASTSRYIEGYKKKGTMADSKFLRLRRIEEITELQAHHTTLLANTVKAAAAEEKVREETRAKAGSTVDITGTAELTGKKGPKAPDWQIEDAKQYKDAVALLNNKEARYFAEHNITSALQQQEYHTNNTVKETAKLGLEHIKNKTLIDDILKAETATLLSKNALSALVTSMTTDLDKQLAQALLQREYLGYVSAEYKVQLDQKAATIAADEKWAAKQLEIGTNKVLLAKAEAVHTAEKTNAELKATQDLINLKLRQAELVRSQDASVAFRLASGQQEYLQLVGYTSLQAKAQKDTLTYENQVSEMRARHNAELAVMETSRIKDPVTQGQLDQNTRLTTDEKTKTDAINKEIGLLTQLRALQVSMSDVAIRYDFQITGFDAVSSSLATLAQGLGDMAALFERTAIAKQPMVDSLAELNAGYEQLLYKLADLNMEQAKHTTTAERQIVIKQELLALGTTMAVNEQQQGVVKKDIASLDDKSGRAAINQTMNLLSANKKMFGEKTAAYKVISIMEKARFAYEIFTTAQTLAASAQKVIASMTEATASGTAGAAAQAGLPFPYNLVAIAGTVAALAALGVSIGGGGGGGSSGARKETDTTGGVLGEVGKQSESITRITDLLSSIHTAEYTQLLGINQGVASLNRGITGTATNLVRSGAFGGGFQDTTTGDISAKRVLGGQLASIGFGRPQDAIKNILKAPSEFLKLLSTSSVKTSVRTEGLNISAGSLASKQGALTLGATRFQEIETAKKKVYGSASYSFKTTESALDKATSNSLSLVYKGFSETMRAIDKGLGTKLGAAIDNYQFSAVSLNLKGLSGEAATKKISDMLSNQGDKMASAVFGELLFQYQKLGEGLLETAVRIIVEKEVILKGLGDIGKAVTGDTIELTQALVELAGGFDKLKESTATFYDKYFTDVEKLTNNQKNLLEYFVEIGIRMPVTTAAFRELVLAQDLTTEAGRKMYTQLLNVAGVFYEVTTATEKAVADATKAYEDKVANINKTHDADLARVNKTYDTEVSRLNKAYNAEVSAINKKYDTEIALARKAGAATTAILEKLSEAALKVVEAIDAQIAAATKTIADFTESLRNPQQSAEALAQTLGVTLATSVEGLANLYNQLRYDTDSLTETDVRLLNANKELILTQMRAVDITEKFTKTLDTTRGMISSLTAISDSLVSIIKKLRDASKDSATNLNDFYLAMGKTQGLSSDMKSPLFAASLTDAITKSDILFQTTAFASLAEQQYAQGVAAAQFSQLNDAAVTEIDYLKMIEENTRLQIEALTASVTDLGARVNAQLLALITSSQRIGNDAMVSARALAYETYNNTKNNLDAHAEALALAIQVLEEAKAAELKTADETRATALVNADAAKEASIQAIEASRAAALAVADAARALALATMEAARAAAEARAAALVEANRKAAADAVAAEAAKAAALVEAGKSAQADSVRANYAQATSSMTNYAGGAFDAKSREGKAAFSHLRSLELPEWGNVRGTAGVLEQFIQIANTKMVADLSFLGLNGYASGGYTGDGGMFDVAGMVHKGEYVVNAATTKDMGLNGQGGFIKELLVEIKELKNLTVKLVADNMKQLQTQRAIYAQGPEVL